MPAGLQLFNESGQLILDYTSHVGRFIGSFTTNGSESGTLSDPRIIGATFFFVGFGSDATPDVTGNSGTGAINWQYVAEVQGQAPPGPEDRMHTVYYGVY